MVRLTTLALGAGLCAASCDETTTGIVLSYAVVRGADQTGEAGAPLGPIVIRVADTRGVPQPRVRLRATPRSGGSVTPAEATTGASGEATFTWTLGPAVGGQELRIQDADRAAEFFVWAVARAPAVALVTVTPPEASVNVGQSQQFAATVFDARGEPLTGRVVVWSSSNPAVANVSAFGGLATALSSGTTIITATSEGKSASANLTVAAGEPVRLAVVTQPEGAVDGREFAVQPVVELRDAAGGLAAGTARLVTASLQSGPGSLSGTLTVQTVDGVARFVNLRVAGVGAHTLLFTSPGLASASSAPFVVADGSSATVIVTTMALPNATLGAAYAVTLTATGGTGNYAWSIVGGATPPGISLSTNGVLSGTPTATGVFTFTVHAASGGESGQRQLTLTVVPPAGGQVPTKLAVAIQPGGAVSGANFTTQPTVVVHDSQGAVVTSSSAAVTASIASGPGVLSGTTTVLAVSGVATFTNLRITGTGSHTLLFTSPGLASTTSAAFSVAAAGGGGGVALNVNATTPVSVQAGQNVSVPIILDMTNAGGANIASIQFTISWDVSKFNFVSGTVDPGAGLSLTPNTSNAASGGVISVAGFAATGVTTTRTLYTVVLTARVDAANSSATVSAAVGAAADQLGNAVTVTPRNLTVNITP